MADLSILGLFAHPDDEQTMSGVLARAASEGMRTGLVCATRGEVGEIADPSLATAETLGHVREGEMRAAAAVLGVKYLRFLDYRDSGMMGTAPNDDPSCFYRADHVEALGKIVKCVREFKPAVMVTFDPSGAYGHPDHLTISRLATEAFSVAAAPARFPDAGEPWQAARFYYTTFPRSVMAKFGRLIEELGIETGLQHLEIEQFGFTDEEITNAIDVREWLPLKEKSLSLHRTQMNPNSWVAKFPRELIEEIQATEHFALAAGVPLPDGPEARGDLFAGLRK